nr:MAG TPA: hypothetical protein [Herelleviridae sp.]
MQEYYCILTMCYMLLIAMVYYLWAVGYDLPGLRLASLVFNRSWQRHSFIR